MSEPASIIFPADVESVDGTSMSASFDGTNEAEPRGALAACATDRGRLGLEPLGDRGLFGTGEVVMTCSVHSATGM